MNKRYLHKIQEKNWILCFATSRKCLPTNSLPNKENVVRTMLDMRPECDS